VFSVIRKIIEERLTKKQKAILDFLSKEENQGKTLYKVVLELSKELNCSRSALYNNINSLKRCGLVANKEGRPLRLTKIGFLILEGLR
jgi:Fe2+ or Zn2+ uptake regulation protein